MTLSNLTTGHFNIQEGQLCHCSQSKLNSYFTFEDVPSGGILRRKMVCINDNVHGLRRLLHITFEDVSKMALFYDGNGTYLLLRPRYG